MKKVILEGYLEFRSQGSEECAGRLERRFSFSSKFES